MEDVREVWDRVGTEIMVLANSEKPVEPLVLLEGPGRVKRLLEVKTRLGAILDWSRSKLARIEKSKQRNVRVKDLVEYSARIAPYARSAPEYRDPLAKDAQALPGYFFCRPDAALIEQHSLLQHVSRQKAEMPSASMGTNPTSINFTAPGHTILLAVNSGPWHPYSPEKPPAFTEAGVYHIRAVSTRETVACSDPLAFSVVVKSSKPTKPADPKPSQQFSGLMLSMDDSDSDD